MIMRNIINPPLSSPPPSAKYRAYEEGWHRVFMYETYAREREKKNKKNESMNVHGWNLFGCVCCKFSFKSYKLVEKNTQSENCQRVIKSNFLTGCCFCDINARENKVTFSLYLFFFLKTVTVETFEITPSDHLPAQRNQTHTRTVNAKKEKKKVNVTLLIRKSSFGWHEDGILDGIERVLAGRQNPESPLLIKCNWRCKSWK